MLYIYIFTRMQIEDISRKKDAVGLQLSYIHVCIYINIHYVVYIHMYTNADKRHISEERCCRATIESSSTRCRSAAGIYVYMYICNHTYVYIYMYICIRVQENACIDIQCRYVCVCVYSFLNEFLCV